MTLTEADNGKTIALHRGDAVVVRLSVPAATGYSWAWEDRGADIVRVVDDASAQIGTAVGGQRYVQWTLEATSTGAARLRLKQWREWEGDASIVKRFEVLLQVGN
jgi:inhibitor of cysteine peptidase